MSVYEVARRLASIQGVRDRSRAMAMLDAILCRDWGCRYYSFDRAWSATEELASMRDGSGNEYSIVFSAAGACARAFDHESLMTPWRSDPPEIWPGIFDALPEAFRAFVEDPACCEEDGSPRVTACFWRRASDAAWSTGHVAFPAEGLEDADGAGRLFAVLTGTAEAYQKFAEEYYEVTVDLTAIQDVFDLRPRRDGRVRPPRSRPANITIRSPDAAPRAYRGSPPGRSPKEDSWLLTGNSGSSAPLLSYCAWRWPGRWAGMRWQAVAARR
jgi:hypothetical protein